jgi:hypothetical protein
MVADHGEDSLTGESDMITFFVRMNTLRGPRDAPRERTSRDDQVYFLKKRTLQGSLEDRAATTSNTTEKSLTQSYVTRTCFI